MPTRSALLLSATVAPGETPYLKLRGPGQRERQYLSALASWCEALPANWTIVVAENSNWPTSAFTEVGKKSGRVVEVLACDDKGSPKGKGVGEAGLIDDFANSGLAQECDWIFKCTGRLFVHNIGKCLPPIYDCEGVCGAIVPSLDHMDSRFFGASRDVFRDYFTDMGGEISEHEGVYMEHVAARRMLSALGAGHTFRPFETLPYLIGRSASLDSSYSGATIRLKTFLRQRVRRVTMDREILI